MAIDLLHDMLYHSKFEAKELNRERSVIVEEINMYEDNPMMYAEDLLEQAMFSGTTLGWEIAGSRKTVTDMTRANMLKFRDNFYSPDNMVIAVAGKIDKSVIRLLEKSFGKVPRVENDKPTFSPFDWSKKDGPCVKIQKKKSEQIQIALGFPGFPYGDKRNRAATILSIALGATMSSRLFLAVRERRGLAYFVRSSLTNYEDAGAFVIRSGLDKSRLDLAAKVIFDELKKVKRYGITSGELRRAKDYLTGKTDLSLEDSLALAEWYAKQELYLDDVKTPDERLSEIKRVSRAQVRDVAKEIFDFDRVCIAGIGPYKSGAELLKHFPI